MFCRARQARRRWLYTLDTRLYTLDTRLYTLDTRSLLDTQTAGYILVYSQRYILVYSLRWLYTLDTRSLLDTQTRHTLRRITRLIRCNSRGGGGPMLLGMHRTTTRTRMPCRCPTARRLCCPALPSSRCTKRPSRKNKKRPSRAAQGPSRGARPRIWAPRRKGFHGGWTRVCVSE